MDIHLYIYMIFLWQGKNYVKKDRVPQPPCMHIVELLRENLFSSFSAVSPFYSDRSFENARRIILTSRIQDLNLVEEKSGTVSEQFCEEKLMSVFFAHFIYKNKIF